MLGLFPPTAGTVILEGVDLATLRRSTLRRARRHLQMVFQDPYESLNPRMTVGDIVAEPLRVHGEAGSPRRAARQGGPRPGVGRPAPGGGLPGAPAPRVVGRAAPAGGHRRRPGAGAARAGGRRTGLDARRLDPGRHPQPAARPGGGQGDRPGDDHPRHVHGGRLQRPHRRDVPGAHRGDRARPPGAPQAPPSLHRGPALGGARPPPRPAPPPDHPARGDARSRPTSPAAAASTPAALGSCERCSLVEPPTGGSGARPVGRLPARRRRTPITTKGGT